MFLRVLAPRRPQPVPFTGTVLSLTAHAVILAAVVGGEASASTRADARAATRAGGEPGGEQLHWIGIAEGSGAERPRSHPGTRPPIAYVVPGHGGLRRYGAGAHTPGRERLRDPAGRATEPIEVPAPALQPASLRRVSQRRTPLHLRAAALSALALPDPEVTLLVAGVLSAAPDLARRAARPEDFVPVPASELTADLLTRTGVLASAMRPTEVHVNDLPIPLVSNPPPAYPAVLAQSRVGGQVVVEFLIDSTGVVNLGSLRVVESTHALFTQAVRSVLPQLRFTPAQLGERTVGVTVRQPFLFTVRSGG